MNKSPRSRSRSRSKSNSKKKKKDIQKQTSSINIPSQYKEFTKSPKRKQTEFRWENTEILKEKKSNKKALRSRNKTKRKNKKNMKHKTGYYSAKKHLKLQSISLSERSMTKKTNRKKTNYYYMNYNKPDDLFSDKPISRHSSHGKIKNHKDSKKENKKRKQGIKQNKTKKK